MTLLQNGVRVQCDSGMETQDQSPDSSFWIHLLWIMSSGFEEILQSLEQKSELTVQSRWIQNEESGL